MTKMNFIIALLPTIFIGALANPLLHSNNLENEESLKIINGNYTTINIYEINVAFLIENNIWGAGVIVGQNWILTTAFNCLWVDPSYITVRVGSTYWTNDGNVISAEKCIMHPNYSGKWAYNIALLKLASNITYGPGSRLAYYGQKNLKIPGATYTVSGWGVRSPTYEKEKQLQYTSQTILDDDTCSKSYNVTGGNFCATNINGGPCVFDFGAPLSRKRTVIGLYQGSTDCTKPQDYPALYVDVYQFKDWITSTMANN